MSKYWQRKLCVQPKDTNQITKINAIKKHKIKVAKNRAKITSFLCAVFWIVLRWDFPLNLWIPFLCRGENSLILSHFLSENSPRESLRHFKTELMKASIYKCHMFASTKVSCVRAGFTAQMLLFIHPQLMPC